MLTIKFRAGTAEENNNFTGDAGVITFNTDDNDLHLHDGITLGGSRLTNLSSVTSLQNEINALDIDGVDGLSGALVAKAGIDLVGVANGIAELNESGKVPTLQLPSFVDDIIEAASSAALPVTGETGKLYITIDDGLVHRWNGSAYVVIAAQPSTTDDIAEGVVNFYYTDQRVRDALSASGELAYNASTGVFSFSESVNSVNGYTGEVVIDNADVLLEQVQNYTVATDIEAVEMNLDSRFLTPELVGDIMNQVGFTDNEGTWVFDRGSIPSMEINFTYTLGNGGSSFTSGRPDIDSLQVSRDGNIWIQGKPQNSLSGTRAGAFTVWLWDGSQFVDTETHYPDGYTTKTNGYYGTRCRLTDDNQYLFVGMLTGTVNINFIDVYKNDGDNTFTRVKQYNLSRPADYFDISNDGDVLAVVDRSQYNQVSVFYDWDSVTNTYLNSHDLTCPDYPSGIQAHHVTISDDKTWVAVGKTDANGLGIADGAVYIFKKQPGGNYAFDQKLTKPATSNGTNMGSPIFGSSGFSKLVIGDSNGFEATKESNTFSGATYVFELSDGSFDYVNHVESDPEPGIQRSLNFLPCGLTLDGQILFTHSPEGRVNNLDDAGYFKTYKWSDANGNYIQNDRFLGLVADDKFGGYVGISNSGIRHILSTAAPAYTQWLLEQTLL